MFHALALGRLLKTIFVNKPEMWGHVEEMYLSSIVIEEVGSLFVVVRKLKLTDSDR